MNLYSRQNLRLLPPAALRKTGEVDYAEWNYRPVLGAFSRARFRLVVALLGETRVGRLLEIGYGSGVLMPELSGRCEELYGIDIHDMPREVSESLSKFGVEARLSTGSVTALPFEDKFFDRLVAVSALEFVEDLNAACVEMKRVLKEGGSLVVVTPGHSPLVDFGLKVLTGNSAKKDFGDRRDALVPTLLRHFVVRERLIVPSRGSSVVNLYTGLNLGA